jgi:hypothetical protein
MSDQGDNVLDHGDQGDRDLDLARDLAGMAGSYRAQTGHLTRVITKADALVAEAVLHAPSKTFLGELERSLAEIRDQQEKCADKSFRTSGTLKRRLSQTRPRSKGV